jgi:uncharacterized protein
VSKTILITGATGLIGKAISDAVTARGDELIAVSTRPAAAAKKLPGAKRTISLKELYQLKNEKIDAVINLAGANLGSKRWNRKTKKEFYDSRINTTGRIVELISVMPKKPEVLVSASGVDYYGDCGSKEVYEDNTPANDYMGKMTRDWEAEARKAETFGVRVVTVRTGFVLGKNSGAIDKLLLPFKFFIGGPLGSGKQFVSWIHINDIVGIYLFAADNRQVIGAINAAAPNPVTMKELAKTIGSIIHRPSFFPAFSFAVKIMAGEIAAAVLNGRRALPKKLLDLGYRFRYEDVNKALKEVLE